MDLQINHLVSVFIMSDLSIQGATDSRPHCHVVQTVNLLDGLRDGCAEKDPLLISADRKPP